MTSVLPSWLSYALPSLELRARIVDFWVGDLAVSNLMSQYLERLGFQVDLVTNATQESEACAFVAARVVNDLHAAGERWWSCDVRRAAEHQWVRAGNILLGRTMSTVVDSGFLACNQQVDQLVKGFWQKDAPTELRLDCSTWFALPGAAPLDHVLADLVEDLHSVATGSSQADLELRLRVPNTGRSTQAGFHWFTIAYSIRHKASVESDCTSVPMEHDTAQVYVIEAGDEDVEDEMFAYEQEMVDALYHEEEHVIDSDEERMADDMIVNADAW